ncbi:beta-aspartyl-peptidase [Citrobacter rodentium]|nr:beta-aspartyl-peptidase [Citrobacter rodentium]KIQ50496.1 isoaspartyl dipeptidase [Citrobacter rodentium]QBY28934.1 beta-aspartyl-peptidase [Citrobacter rodentium]UHO29205.1 beta-aspartyl-peptidase [Citrobacter rodentium NBRC 105723 = DSM 16636]HAT8011796.1 beta-aspartyl-peptidase [Citrobacter rodentium NBRC 105723 = DSM 16636]HAT8016608.1 beta-aspartyl-peptidase [Citrobacter rodentium]
MNCSILNLTLFQRGHVYAPEDLGVQDILVAGGKIVAIAPAIAPGDFPGCQCIDLEGAIVCPGFIDQHVHLIGGGGEAGPHTRTPEVRLSRLVEAGITSVVGLLGTDGITRHPESLLAKTRALETEGISAWMLTGAYSLPSPTITGSVDRDVALIDKIIGVKCAISDHRSSAPTAAALATMAAQSRVGGLLGQKAGISVFHMGNSLRMLEPLYEILASADVPITKLLPTHVNRAEPLFHAALEYAREGGYIDITSSIDEPVDPATAIITALQNDVPLSRITLSSDGNGSQPEFDEHGNLIGIGVAGFDSLAQTLRRLVNHHQLPLAEALCPLTRTVAEFLGLEQKGRLAVGCDADILVLNEALEVNHLWAKGKAMVRDKRACVKGTFE